MSITKTAAEKYELRGIGKNKTWADIIICRPYELSIISDLGDYSHVWTNIGQMGFKEFLCQINPDYLMGKLSTQSWFEAQRTADAILKESDQLGAVATAIRSCTSLHEATHILANSDEVDEIMGDSAYWPIIMDYSPQLREFMKVVWPVFIDELKRENPWRGASS